RSWAYLTHNQSQQYFCYCHLYPHQRSYFTSLSLLRSLLSYTTLLRSRSYSWCFNNSCRYINVNQWHLDHWRLYLNFIRKFSASPDRKNDVYEKCFGYFNLYQYQRSYLTCFTVYW